MCGAPVPQSAFIKQEKEDKRSPMPMVALGLIAIATIIFLVVITTRPRTSGPTAPEPITNWVTEYQPTPDPEPEIYTPAYRYPPHEAFTDPGLRQALELFFAREITHINWEDIDEIHVLLIERESVSFGLNNEDDPVMTHPNSDVQNLYQLAYFANLEVLTLSSTPTQDALSGLPNIRILDVPAGRTITNLSTFTVLPKLERLTVNGRNFTALQGITDLPNLYAINLTATGVVDLSILSQQRNITELSFTDNRELASFNTLQDMTWLRSLHIERSSDRDLHFISHLTNLESLTLIRTDTRTYNFILPLVNLRYLRLFDNRDVPEIPSLAGFTVLEELHLDTGRNTGTVRPVDFLEGLTSVWRMSLHNPDNIDGIRGMTNLEELAISFGWLLTDASPLGDLTNLRFLQIHSSRVFGSEVSNMSAIGRLTNLRYLNLSGNELYFNWNFIFAMENLEELNISRNNVVGDISRISAMQNLHTLHMNKINLMGNYRIQIDGGMTSIFFIDRYDLQDHTNALAALTGLTALSISSNDIRSIDFVSSMENLQIFIAEDNFISDVSPLAHLENLELVDLRRNAVGNWGELDHMINTTILGR